MIFQYVRQSHRLAALIWGHLYRACANAKSAVIWATVKYEGAPLPCKSTMYSWIYLKFAPLRKKTLMTSPFSVIVRAVILM